MRHEKTQRIRNGETHRRLKHKILEEDWGEGCEEESGQGHQEQSPVTLPPPPVIRRGGEKPALSSLLTSSVITDYFSPKPKRRRMERCDNKEWSDEDDFLSCTQEYVESRSGLQGSMGD